eukprot:102907_1
MAVLDWIICVYIGLYAISGESTSEPTNEPTVEPTLSPVTTPQPTLYAEKEAHITTTIYTTTTIHPIQIEEQETNKNTNEINNFFDNKFFFLALCVMAALVLICLVVILVIVTKKHCNKNTKSIKPNLKMQVKSHTNEVDIDHDVMDKFVANKIMNGDVDENNIEKYIDLRKFQKSVVQMNSTPIGDIAKSNDGNQKVIIDQDMDSTVIKEMYSALSNDELLKMDINIVMPPIAPLSSEMSNIEEGSTTNSYFINRKITSYTDDGGHNDCNDSHNKYNYNVGDENILFEESKNENYITDNEDSICSMDQIQTTMGNENNYEWIENALKKCDNTEWYKYLHNFKKHKINEQRLKHLPNDDEDLWKEVIPEIGIRYQFKALWKNRQMNL